ncbi:MAG: nitroreductase family protein [Spirochaetota bacterium]
MMYELSKQTRSYRRFDESRPLSTQTLNKWIEHARISASAMNAQPLRYITIADSETNARVFPMLKWAGHLSDWPGPSEGERPTGYIVVFHDREVAVKSEFVWCDAGIASQNVLLAATEDGFGGCIIASVNWRMLQKTLSVDDRYEPLFVIALGVPIETVQIVDLPDDRSIKYYRDESQTHYVPKRPISELLLNEIG